MSSQLLLWKKVRPARHRFLQLHLVQFTNGSLGSAGSSLTLSTVKGNEIQKLSTTVSIPLSVPNFQDDNSWEGVHGPRGWKQISWQVGFDEEFGAVAFSLLTRCAVCITLKHTRVFI